MKENCTDKVYIEIYTEMEKQCMKLKPLAKARFNGTQRTYKSSRSPITQQQRA